MLYIGNLKQYMDHDKWCPELAVTSLDMRVGEIPIHFSGSWYNKGRCK